MNYVLTNIETGGIIYVRWKESTYQCRQTTY